MTKPKRKNKILKLIGILPPNIIHEFLNYSYEERKAKLKEASEFIKQKNIFGY